tara:strand:- start:1156 stop:1725 length:570 start_codon:yes stop_codon:yes gene_type:complete
MDTILTGEWYTDSFIMYDYLSQLHLVTGNERSGTKFFNREKNSKKPESTLFGYTWRRNMGKGIREFDEEKQLYKTKLMSENPELLTLFKEFSNHYFSWFEWNNVQINYMPIGTVMKQHLDKKNVGESYLIAFGAYKGGDTYVENKKDRNFTLYDCRVAPLVFNGSERKHGVSTVQDDDRYSLVFFNNTK